MRTIVHKLDFYVKSEDIFEQYKNRKMAVFLDSSLENQLGQFSIIGLEPYLILKEEDGVFYKNDEPQFETFEFGMKKALQKYQEKIQRNYHWFPVQLVTFRMTMEESLNIFLPVIQKKSICRKLCLHFMIS